MTRTLNRILLALLAVGGLAAQPAIAQSNGGYTATQQDLPQNQDQSSDPFSRNANIESMFDLIHRANFGDIRSPGQFQQDQNQNINSEAERFRQQQQQLLQQPKPQGTVQVQPAPTATPAPIQPQ